MRNSRMKICTLLLLAGFAVTGCGDKLTSLTPDQENFVVSYSAHVVAKYNKGQTDGITYVNTQNEASTQSSENVNSDKANAKNEQTKTNSTEVNMKTETQTQTASKAQDMPAQDTQNSMPALPEEASLTDALGIPSITATVVSYGAESQITDQSFTLDLTPETGMKSMVLHVDLTNQGDSQVQCDLLSSNANFQLVVNQSLTVESEKSSLQSDLSAYNQTIKAGDVNHAVLIFSIPQDTNVDTLKLITTINNVSSTTNIL